LASSGIQAGGIFVDRSAEQYFRKKFYDGDLNPDQVSECIAQALDKFVEEVKPAFQDRSGDHLIAVADRRFSDQYMDIERGFMTLSG
jgi:hypothetical protein